MSAKPLEDKTAGDKTAEDLIAAARALAPEAVFAEPWEAHAFAVAVALCEAGQFRWAEFQQSLIEEIGAADVEALVTRVADGHPRRHRASPPRLSPPGC